MIQQRAFKPIKAQKNIHTISSKNQERSIKDPSKIHQRSIKDPSKIHERSIKSPLKINKDPLKPTKSVQIQGVPCSHHKRQAEAQRFYALLSLGEAEGLRVPWKKHGMSMEIRCIWFNWDYL